MSKAENIFRDTRHSIYRVMVDDPHTAEILGDNWVYGCWCYGKTPKGQQYMTQRTLNAVKRLVDREERRLDDYEKFGIEYDAKWRECVRVLRDMIANTQKDLDLEKERRRAIQTMSFDDYMAKYYPQYC